MKENFSTEELLKEKGWVKTDIGAKYKNDYNKKYNLYIRRTELREYLEDKTQNEIGLKIKNSPNQENNKSDEKPDKYKADEVLETIVSKDTMGTRKDYLTPSVDLPSLSHFSDFESLKELHSTESSLIIAYDSEWYYPNGNEYGYRSLISWQFACVYNDYLYEFIFTKTNQNYDLDIGTAIARILDELDYVAYDRRNIIGYKSLCCSDSFKERVYKTKKEAIDNSKIAYSDGKFYKVCYDVSAVGRYNITLLCHAALFDITGFDKYNDKEKGFINRCKSIGGGTVTLNPICLNPVSLKNCYNKSNHPRIYPVSLNIADTMCHTSADNSSLDSLGKSIGIHKIYIDNAVKSCMRDLFVNDPVLYFEYASRDSVVTLLYAASLYGYNKKIPVTITSAGCNIMMKKMMSSLNVTTTEEFNRVYRGLEREIFGLEKKEKIIGKCVFNEKSSLVAISDDVRCIHQYASNCYHGGYNICSEVGYYTRLTFDFDLKNAYPTVMCLVPDVNWECCIEREYNNYELTLEDFKEHGKYNPLKMFLCRVTYEFSSDVKCPSIMSVDEGIPLFFKSSDGVSDGVYASGPELYLALKLGAKVFVKRGYLVNTDFDGKKRYTLRSCVKGLVDDRTKAKKMLGKGSLEELILKLIVNGGYGKISQDVTQKFTYNDYRKCMEDIGCSKITNPVSACFITSIVRTLLIATQNQICEKGYNVYSVTTDGFISDIPIELLEKLDLYGFKDVIESSRLYLTDNKDASFWEIKHVQDDLLNFCTRGNVSLHDKEHNPIYYNDRLYEGVCAHNSLKSGYISDTYEDRKWLFKAVVSRAGKIENKIDSFTSLRDVIGGIAFRKCSVSNNSYCNFDFKRKPIFDSFKKVDVVIDDEKYEVMNFKTDSFDNINEYRRYKVLKDRKNCLRTEREWNKFKADLVSDKSMVNRKIRNWDKRILDVCIMRHRLGECTIVALDVLKGKKRLEWINKHNKSTKSFTENDWKNMGKAERSTSMNLDDDIIKDKLDELMNATDYEEYLK